MTKIGRPRQTKIRAGTRELLGLRRMRRGKPRHLDVYDTRGQRQKQPAFRWFLNKMMTTLSPNENAVAREIIDHVSKCGGSYSSWYAGIASNPKERLFSDHNVSEENGSYIARSAGSAMAARRIEQYLLELGFNGGPGGGDASTIHVYVYIITNSTVE